MARELPDTEQGWPPDLSSESQRGACLLLTRNQKTKIKGHCWRLRLIKPPLPGIVRGRGRQRWSPPVSDFAILLEKADPLPVERELIITAQECCVLDNREAASAQRSANSGNCLSAFGIQPHTWISHPLEERQRCLDTCSAPCCGVWGLAVGCTLAGLRGRWSWPQNFSYSWWQPDCSWATTGPHGTRCRA